MDYRPYYFYDDVVAHYQNFNGFPCMILTSEYAIVCTSDYQKGFLYKGANICSFCILCIILIKKNANSFLR